jgi:hypothetical protein
MTYTETGKAIGFALEQPLHVVALPCSALRILKQLQHIPKREPKILFMIATLSNRTTTTLQAIRKILFHNIRKIQHIQQLSFFRESPPFSPPPFTSKGKTCCNLSLTTTNLRQPKSQPKITISIQIRPKIPLKVPCTATQ